MDRLSTWEKGLCGFSLLSLFSVKGNDRVNDNSRYGDHLFDHQTLVS